MKINHKKINKTFNANWKQTKINKILEEVVRDLLFS
jgi:hypothetical protein